jgi:hypothetical protein
VPYTQTTWLSLQSSLQNRLDEKGIFYTNSAPSEVQIYLTEALRAWNAYANRYRERITVTFGPGLNWFDLHTSAVMAKSITNTDIVTEIQTHFMEPPTGLIWVGSDMFTISQVLDTLQKRRDQFLLQTGLEQVRQVGAIPISAEGRFTFQGDVIDVRRLAWIDHALPTLPSSPLWRTDQWESTAQSLDWNYNPALVPAEFSITEAPPLQCTLIPPPMNVGEIDRIVTKSGASLIGGNTLLGVPDDLAWAVKWGTMADLLGKENQARDPLRAQYCEQRYAEGVQLANNLPIVLNVFINGRPATTVSLQDLDANEPGWANTAGTPQVVGISNYLITLFPLPIVNTSVTLDVLRPAPIPTLDTDFVQLGLEELNTILDYAHHIATFKESGVEFEITQRQRQNFIQTASLYNDRLSALAFFRQAEEEQRKAQDYRYPRKASQDEDE